MSHSVDLSQLAVSRSSTAALAHPPATRGRWLCRYVLPALLIAGFATMLGWAGRDSLLPSTPVTVTPVLVSRAEVQQTGSPLFQAAGWVEPRPATTVVTALAAGVVAEVNVIEGQLVEQGEIIARLIDTDARLALREAQAALSLHEANVEAAQAELASAKLGLEKPLQLQAELAEAESALAQMEAELNGLPAALTAAQTRCLLAQEGVEKKEIAGDAIAGRILREAKAELASATAALTQLESQQPLLSKQHAALMRKRDSCREQLEFKLGENRRLSAAQTGLKAAEARAAQARLAVEVAQLELDRTIIRAPFNGRVLSILATAGKRVSGLDAQSEQGSSAIATLYEPKRLQVRVDVRLEDVPRVQSGQPVRIETAAVPSGLTGDVIATTSVADVQKNTLSVKVGVNDPPDVLRPEMLTQVTFLAPEVAKQPGSQSQEKLRMLIPRPLASTGEGGTYVWVADRQLGMARRQPVSLGTAGTADLVEVVEGVNPTDRLICTGRESLSEGTRIRIVGDDVSLGIGNQTPMPEHISRTVLQPESKTSK